MKSIAAFALGLGLLGCLGLAARAQEKKDEKKDEKKVEAPKLEGKYVLVSGKKDGTAVGDDAKKGEYIYTPEKITIKGMGLTFVMGYKLDPKTTPIGIDMEILEGPEGTKGTKAYGIIEAKGDVIKLAYTLDKEKEKRPTKFDGKEGFMFEFKKAK